jgi:hypothetical protein
VEDVLEEEVYLFKEVLEVVLEADLGRSFKINDLRMPSCARFSVYSTNVLLFCFHASRRDA